MLLRNFGNLTTLKQSLNISVGIESFLDLEQNGKIVQGKRSDRGEACF